MAYGAKKIIDGLQGALDWTRGNTAARERSGEIIRKWLRTDTLKLHAGEMTAQELRTVKAVLRGVLAEIEGRP